MVFIELGGWKPESAPSCDSSAAYKSEASGQAHMLTNTFSTLADLANCRASSSIPFGFRFLSFRRFLCRRLGLISGLLFWSDL
jgi:hypothetical protein